MLHSSSDDMSCLKQTPYWIRSRFHVNSWPETVNLNDRNQSDKKCPCKPGEGAKMHDYQAPETEPEQWSSVLDVL